jgi:ketosteroid isomerase-like protein
VSAPVREEKVDPIELIELGMRLYEAGDLSGLRALVHEDAEIQMAYLHGELARGPRALEEALRAAAHSVHRPRMDGVVAIDESAAILHGRVRYPVNGGGFGDRQAAWLNVLKDGLMWRVRIYADVEAARRAYAEEFLPELRG